MDKDYAKYLLKKTKNDYNKIAEHFSSKRFYIWEEIKTLIEPYIKEKDKILDLGCGNGRLIELFRDKDIEYIGVDNSKRLIEIAKEKYPHYKFLVSEAINLPFEDSYFNKVISVAVLHHIPSKEFRLKFLEEAERVLKPNGILILTVWNLWQRKIAWNLLFKYTIFKIFGKSKLDFKDVFYPWKDSQGKILIQRYIHCFTKKELKELAKKAGFKIKEIGFIDRGNTKKANIYLVAQKPS